MAADQAASHLLNFIAFLAPQVGLEPTTLRLTGDPRTSERLYIQRLKRSRKSFLEHFRRATVPKTVPCLVAGRTLRQETESQIEEQWRVPLNDRPITLILPIDPLNFVTKRVHLEFTARRAPALSHCWKLGSQKLHLIFRQTIEHLPSPLYSIPIKRISVEKFVDVTLTVGEERKCSIDAAYNLCK